VTSQEQLLRILREELHSQDQLQMNRDNREGHLRASGLIGGPVSGPRWEEATMSGKQHALRVALALAMAVSLWVARPAQTAAGQANGAISGCVRDWSGNPVGDVFVGAGDYDSIASCGGMSFGIRTDWDGTYRLEVPPGTYLVVVATHGRDERLVPQAYLDVRSWSDIARALRVVVTSGQTVSGVDLRLTAGFRVSGRLVDAYGQPVRDAEGHVGDPDQRIEFGCALGFASSGADGRFVVTVPAGSYDLSFALGGEGRHVRYAIPVASDVALGDVLFAEVQAPPVVFNPRVLEPGYTAETVVAGAPNVTCDVAIGGDDSIYLAAPGSAAIYKVGLTGVVTLVATVGVFAVDAAADGNLYGYFAPEGTLFRITPAGQVTTIGAVSATACECSMTVGPSPELHLWVGLNDCGGTSLGQGSLLRMTQGGQVQTMAANLPFGINGLDFGPDGQLYVTIVDELYRFNPQNGQRQLLATLPQHSTSHGLVVGPTSEFYISSRALDADRVYRVSASGAVSVFATLPPEYIMGLGRLSNGELIAAMRASGAMYRIRSNGTWQRILPGNGMTTPQAMAFSPSGELYVCNGESGSIGRVAGGRASPFAEVLSYILPMGYLAFLPTGELYFSEAAPGFQPRLVRISPWGQVREVTRDLDFPAGLAFTPAGTLHVAEYESGEVSAVSPGGAVTLLATGMNHPQAVAADAAGVLYAAARWCRGDKDCIWRIQPDGSKTWFADLEPIGLRDLAFGPDGDLFVSGPAGRQSGVLRIAPDGSVKNLAVGYLVAAGLAFDLAGNLYVSDDRDNSITRITGFPRGTLQGRVSDADTGLPIAGARVSVATGYPVILGTQVTVGSDGRYSVPVAPRTYTVVASARSYAAAWRQAQVTAGVALTADLALSRALSVYLPVVLKGL
jgi:sugar lactone lactonase YvrE